MITPLIHNLQYEEIFMDMLEKTGLNNDHAFYRKVESVKESVQFYQEFMNRTKRSDEFSFKPVLQMRGIIHDGFMRIINSKYNFYDYEMLSTDLYAFEILVRLFHKAIIHHPNLAFDNESIRNIAIFAPVVKYLLDVEFEQYSHSFIGSNYTEEKFFVIYNQMMQELSNE